MDDRKTPAWLLALGHEEPPSSVEVDGVGYRLDRLYKHDFFALTARYAPAPERGSDAPPSRFLIAKFGRKKSLFGVPMGWLGRFLVRREARAYRALADLPAVPRLAGIVGTNGLAHEYVEGRELRRGDTVPDDFFLRLAEVIADIHGRGMAYVDLEKLENVLIGDDGRPYLVDFQLSWCPRWGADSWPLRRIRGWLQQGDRYHLKKLQRRVRPDQMTRDELRDSRQKPALVRFHSCCVRPLQRARRGLLQAIDPVPRRGERGRIYLPSELET